MGALHRHKRVSAFVYLYRLLNLGWAPARARPDLDALWTPDGVWASFIARQPPHLTPA